MLGSSLFLVFCDCLYVKSPDQRGLDKQTGSPLPSPPLPSSNPLLPPRPHALPFCHKFVSQCVLLIPDAEGARTLRRERQRAASRKAKELGKGKGKVAAPEPVEDSSSSEEEEEDSSGEEEESD